MCSLLIVTFRPLLGTEHSGQQINAIDGFIQLLMLMYSKECLFYVWQNLV